MRILIISIFFAPIGGVATERIRKFIKYLPDFGFEPIVLSQTIETYQQLKPREIDESVLQELPDSLKIIRAPGPVLDTPRQNGQKHSTLRRLLTRIFMMFLLPDKHILWTRSAVRKGKQIISSEKVDIILATGPSFSSFVVGALLNKLTDRPLILDYRDPGALNSIFFPRSPVRRMINRKIEKWCLSRMDAALFATEGFRTLYTRKYPSLTERCHVISNGYDGEIEQHLPRVIHSSEPIKIAYAGKMHGDQYPVVEFFKAIKQFTQIHGKAVIDVQMAGEISTENKQFLADTDLLDVVNLRGYLLKSDVEKMLLDSDLLLLIIGDGHPFLYGLESAKLYDYLRYSHPILALVPEEGVVWQFINNNNLGSTTPPSDANRILQVLENLNTQLRSNNDLQKNNKATKGNIEQFHRRELTSQLANLCSLIIKNSS